MRSKKWKAAFAALALSVALLAQPLTASAWMLDAEQQQLVDNLTSGQEALLLGNYAQAVNDLSRAVELNSNSVSAYYYRARALQYMGRSTDAAADYSRVAVMTRNGNYGSRYSDDFLWGCGDVVCIFYRKVWSGRGGECAAWQKKPDFIFYGVYSKD